MDIRVVRPEDRDLWDALVQESPDSTIFHTWKWLSVMEKHSRRSILGRSVSPRLYPLAVHDQNEILGLIPIFLYQTPVMTWAHSPPDGVECLYLGPVFPRLIQKRPRDRYQLGLEFQNRLHVFLVQTLHARSIKIRSSPGLEDPRGFIWNGYEVEPRFTYVLDLKVGEAEIWKNFRKTLKNSITRSQRSALRCIEGSKRDLDLIYSLLERRNRIQAPREFLHEIADTFCPDNAKIFIVKNGEESISGLIVTMFKNKVSFWVGSPKILFQGTSPNEYLLWTVIRWAIEEGYEYFEVVGADDPALFSFKNKFNAELVGEYWVKWNSPGYRFFYCFLKLIKGNG